MKIKKFIWVRRIIQSVFFVGLLYIIWSTKYPLNSSLNPSMYFKLDPLAMLVTAVAERVFLAGLFYSLFVLAFTFVFGRVFCGWFCPLGALQDLWASALDVISRKHRESEPTRARAVKYFILAPIIVLAALGVQAAWALDPIAIFVRTFSFNIFPLLNKTIDTVFIFILKRMENPGPVETIYYYFKDNLIALNSPVFPHTAAVFAVMILILAAVVYKRRFWCRFICPLGALLALVSRHSLLERSSGLCKGNCSLCRARCRMNAIKTDNNYVKEECVLCMDCTLRCPGGYSKFMFGKKRRHKHKTSEKGITRAQFLVYITGALAFISGAPKLFAGSRSPATRVIRPPAALPEEKFVQRCIRCGNCMKVCPTNVLQPALFESGLSGVWTPRFDTNIGYCEYKCNLCGSVCPTAAIESLTIEQKMGTKMGVAEIDQRLCLPWAKGTECIVCEEHCPVADKAIKLVETKNKDGAVLKLPSVDPYLCVGCAICEFKCPVTPVKAIKVKPL